MSAYHFPGDDRRRFQRLCVNLNVFYTIDTPISLRSWFGDKEREAVALDLSPGGMALVAQHTIPLRAVLRIKFMIFKTDQSGMVSFSEPVIVIGEVRSNIPLENNEYRLGICFKYVETTSQAAINDFMDSALRV